MAKKGSTGSAGRFGARYGRVSRRRVSEIEDEMNNDHTCPDCGSDAVSRQGTGIWQCAKCDHKFAGGAYKPATPGGRAVTRSIRAALGEGEEDVEVDADVEAVEE
ncbi:50S ribosomal protein L37ae [Halobacterium hubeiense]|uniref:50S ribosomal protein L37ae n=1 Tax=Halobacterium hubeiense TaxID=1407499 RepID=UPI003C724464